MLMSSIPRPVKGDYKISVVNGKIRATGYCPGYKQEIVAQSISDNLLEVLSIIDDIQCLESQLPGLGFSA